MSLRTYPGRLLIVTALTSLFTVGLGGSVAVSLFYQQSTTADVVGENIGSRHAAASLEETLLDLIALYERGATDTVALRERVHQHLTEIADFADKPEEVELYRALAASYDRYLALAGSPPAALARHLRSDTLPRCLALRDYNVRQIEESDRVHRQAMRWLAWGLAAVGGLGSLAGLVFGYGLARGLSQSIHQLRVRVQGAADLLGQELPAVVLQAGAAADPLHDQLDQVVRQVEQAIDRLQQRERELRRAERLAALGQLAAGVAHEIRNPLTSIKILVQAAREDPGGTLPAEDLQVIDHEIRRVERSLQTFLDYARPPRLERAEHDLAALVDHVLSLVRGRADKQQVALRFLRPAGPVRKAVDGGQLQQVLVNLALNALDAMPRGGVLEVALRAAEGGAAEMTVRDTGPGIAADLLPRLFEPFVSGKVTGLGLGLVVSRRIAEDHGGTLRAANRPDGGACFTLRLP